MRKGILFLAGSFVLVVSIVPASASALLAYPDTPALSDSQGTVVGNTTESAPGFGSQSWQATGAKTNFYVTPQDLFGTSNVTVGQVASMSYWSNTTNSPGTANWNLYIYTVPDGSSSNSQSWYKSRLIATPAAGAPGWDQWTTETGATAPATAIDFSDPDRNAGNYATNITWGNITSGTVTWASSGTARDYSNETVKYFSLQTDSGAHSFTGLLDGFQVSLTSGATGSVNFEAAPEPGTWALMLGAGLVGLGFVRRRPTR